MNEIKVSVNFKTGECRAYDYEPINNDYNVSKLVFNFDEEYTGRKVVEIRPVGDDKNATFSSEIIDNEVVLVKEENGQNKSIFTKAGQHVIEVHLYNDGSKITATGTRTFNVKEEQINIGDSQATVYLPVFDQMIQELDNGLDNLSSGLNSLNEAIAETNNLDLDVSKEGKVATVTLTKKNASTKVVTLSDGTSLMFHWRGTYLGIKTDKDDEYTYVNLQGIQGEKGETGAPFRIKKTYANIQLMIADYDNMQVDDHVMISGNVEQEDNAKLFTKTETEDPIYRWQYLGDFSGATGIQGETGLTPNIQIGSVVSGDSPGVTRTGTNENPVLNFVLQKGETGATGPTGATGNGIVGIIKTGTSGLVDTYTITYTNGTTSTFEVTNGEDGEVTETELNVVRTDVDDLRRNQLMNTETGSNINVDDAFDTRIMESVMSKESSQETTTGKNKFDKDNIKWYRNNSSWNITQNVSDIRIRTSEFLIEGGKTYIVSGYPSNVSLVAIRTFSELLGNNTNDVTRNGNIFTLGNDVKYIHLLFSGTNFTDETNVLMKNANIQIEEGTTATEWEKYTGGIPAPNPDYPQEVKTVKGYRNLFDKNNIQDNYAINRNNNNGVSLDGYATSDFCEVKPNTNYYLGINFQSNNYGAIFYDKNKLYLEGLRLNNTFLTPSNCYYVRFSFIKANYDINNIELVEGTESLPYVPYGTNWVYTKVSNGTDTNYYTIPLNNNEIVGIGDYKDELIVDKNGHCWLNKKTGKVVLDGSETVAVSNTGTPNWYYVVVKSMENYIAGIGMSTHYPLVSISNSNTSQGFNLIGSPKSIRIRYGTEDSPENFKNWLSNNNVEIYDVLATENLIDLNYDVDIRLFNGVNNILNSDDMNMEITYVQDINTIINELRNGILGGE